MSRSSQFEKFFVDKKNNAAIKEQFKQDKKKEKKERAAAIDKYYDDKRKQKALAREQAAKPAATAPARGTHASKKTGKSATSTQKVNQQEISNTEPVDLMPLNKYVAHSGVCARREAAILVKEGKVSVNGQVITEPGFKVSEKDLVKVNDKKVIPSRNFVYILLNKPKDYITTNDDPQGRKTVLELVKHATTERVYPVGRLDRNTSGVLLLTNDGELAQKLSHPKHEIKKIYEVHLDKSLTKGDFDKS
jgi:23S rRNA pseudouridine2605 synthase